MAPTPWDTMADHLPLEDLNRALNIYLNDETGIRFNALAWFAEPLFELYEVDPRGLGENATLREAEETATLLAVLETARLFWTYFSLDETCQHEYRPELEAALVGPHASDEDHLHFGTLLQTLAEQWHDLPPEHLEAVPGYALPPFTKLLALYTGEATEGPGLRYGPEQLEPAEALALFARPLLEDPAVSLDPDALDAALNLAHEYWELAQAPPDEYEYRLHAIQQLYGSGPASAEKLSTQASTMVTRFHTLFPEQRK